MAHIKSARRHRAAGKERSERTMDRLDRLEAIAAIHALKARYFRCMDTKDWAGLEAVFAPA